MLWTQQQQDMYTIPTTTTNNNNCNSTTAATHLYINTANMPNQTFISSASPLSATSYKFTAQPAYDSQPNQFHLNPNHAGSISSGTEEEEHSTTLSNRRTTSKKRKSSRSLTTEEDKDDEKRKQFLERNRQAALKCRQRKKQWLNSLQERVEFLANDNEQLQLQANVMRDEVMNLRNLLMAHKDCPMTVTNPKMMIPPHYQQYQPPQPQLYDNHTKVFVE